MQLSQIIQVEKLLNLKEIAFYHDILSRPLVADITKTEVALYRQKVIQQGITIDTNELIQHIVSALKNKASRDYKK